MRKRNINGFISIELVIVAALILSAGTVGVVSLGSNGSTKMEQAMNELDSTITISPPISQVNWYDANGYDVELNVNPVDINPISDFTFTLNTEGDGWILTSYKNTTDRSVVIPKFHTDGLPIVEIGTASLSRKNLTSVVIPNGVKVIGTNAFGGSSTWPYDNNDFSSIYIPASVTTIGEKAFYLCKVEKWTFRGATPNIGVNAISLGSTSTLGDIKVPSEYYDAYKVAYPNTLQVGYNINWTPVHKPYDGTWYDKELDVPITDINPLTDFIFNFDEERKEYIIIDYINTTDYTVVVPKYFSDGWPITQVGERALAQSNLTGIILPNSIRILADFAFYGSSTWPYDNNDFSTVYIPSSVTSIGEKAFTLCEIENLIFRGVTPTFGASAIDMGSTARLGSIRVPAEYYDEYKVADPANYMVGYNVNWVSVHKPYDMTWYDSSLNIQGSEVNLASDFIVTLDWAQQGYYILSYLNTTDLSVVIPKYYTDGLPIIGIGDNTFHQKNLASIALPDSIKLIGNSAFGNASTSYNSNNDYTSIIIPSSVTEIRMNAFRFNKLSKVIFKGALPNILETNIFAGNNGLTAGTISVPIAYLSAYQAVATSAFAQSSADFIGY